MIVGLKNLNLCIIVENVENVKQICINLFIYRGILISIRVTRHAILSLCKV